MEENKEGGQAPAPITKNDLLKSLGGIKDALEGSLKKKADEQEKNLDEKLKAINAAIEELKNIKPEVTAKELEDLKHDAEITQKALDIMQTRMKGMQAGSLAEKPAANFTEQLFNAVGELKAGIQGDKVKGGSFVTNIQLKAVGDMTIASNLTGAIPNTYRTGIVPVPFEKTHMRDIVAVTPSDTDSYHFYRHSIGEGTIEFQNQELETKAQIDEDMSEQTVNLNYLAGWLRISRKMLRNFKGLQGYLSRWLPERYYRREDTKAYQALISAASGITVTTGTDMMSQIVQTIGAQRKAGYNVNGIVMDGVIWGKMLTYKASTSGEFTNPLNIVNVTSNGMVSILGVPVYVTAWVGGDEIIIGDWNFFEIIQSEGLSLQFFDQDGTNVRENKITARIEASVGFAVLDPRAFSVLSVESIS